MPVGERVAEEPSRPPGPGLPRWVMLVFYGFAAVFYLCAGALFGLDALYQVQPGGPVCLQGSTCPTSPLYDPGVHSVELLVGIMLTVMGSILLGCLLYVRARQAKRPVARPA